MAKSLFHPPCSAEILGFSKQITPWIGVNLDETYKYTDPMAGYSLSRVHTYMRQVRVIIIELRQKLDRINEEIKPLLKFKEGLAKSLDELNTEIRAKTPEAVVNRPRFIKNRTKEAESELYNRGVVAVKFEKSETKSLMQQLRHQYSVVKDQLQVLGNTRDILSKAIIDRVRVLDMLPYVTAASVKARHREDEKLRSIAYAEKVADRARIKKNTQEVRRRFSTSAHTKSSNTTAKKVEEVPKIPKYKSTGHISGQRKKCIDESIKRTKSIPLNTSPKPPSDCDSECKMAQHCFCNPLNNDKCQPGICPGCSSCLPNALTNDCRFALRTATQIRGISRRTRRSVKGVVKECFTNEPYEISGEESKAWSNYKVSGACNHKMNPYQAYYKKSHFALKSNAKC